MSGHFREIRTAVMCSPQDVWKCVAATKEHNPLIQCITNLVSMDLMANVLLAGGANPAMVRHYYSLLSDFLCSQNTMPVLMPVLV